MNGRALPVLRRFVVFEGLDGAGTTTQLRILETKLAERGLPRWLTFEPTDLPTGRLVRQVLRGEVEARPETLARLFSADRHEHLYGPEGILERLGRGELVISDRYIFSSLAYQGVACGRELPALLNGSFPLPELLIFFDLPTSVSMARVESRSQREIFETTPIQERVKAAYEEILANYSDTGMKLLRIEASRSVDEISSVIGEAVEKLLGIELSHYKQP